MNKSLLCAGLMTILCTTAQAENNNTPSATDAPQATPPTVNTPVTAPGATVPVTPATNNQTIPSPQQKPEALTTPQVLDCNYHIPAQTTQVDQTLVKKWSEKAAVQSFDFNYKSLDQQLTQLKNCYTDQGWQGFNNALQESGNLAAIKSQELMVSSMVEGDIKINAVKDNQWKVSLPMQVVYQNDKQKITQPLNVDLLVGRKISGDLGIMQMIAIPRQANNSGTAPASTSPAQAQPTATPQQ